MYNETIRKITSLSLLTILLTSSAVFALPNALPEAHAASNANLFVSAENSQFNNYFSGPQVIQVIVSDPDINRLDQPYGEPVVTINGKRIRMAQATDGNWYAYFADRTQAIAAQNTATIAGHGLNFGGFCNSASPLFTVKTGVDFSETKGFTIAKGGMGSANTTVTAAGLPACDSTVAVGTPYQMEHVVRENKTINSNPAGFGAGLGPYSSAWPIIQLYDFAGFPTSVVVDYQKAGGDQIVNLTFDRMPQNLISMSSDRSSYPVNTQVFLTMNDQALNIDPTEEDSWTWGANAANSTLIYEDFTRNGAADSDGTAGAVNLIPQLTNFMFNKNGKFTLDPVAQGINVVNFQQNGKEKLTPQVGPGPNPGGVATLGGSITAGDYPVTFIESGGVNTGVFTNKDGSNIANLVTANNNNIRGVSSTYFYNDVSQSIVGGFGFGTISVTAVNGTWKSGQKIPVTLVDTDANKNSKLSEHLDVDLANVGPIPAMKIGTPFSIAAGDTATLFNNVTTHSGPFQSVQVNASAGQAFPFGVMPQRDAFSATGLMTPVFPGNNTKTINANQALVFDLTGSTVGTLQKTVLNNVGNTAPKFKGFNLFNYDLRSLTESRNNVTNNGQITSGEWFLLVNTTNPVATPFNPTAFASNNAAVGSITAISIANVTSLQGTINLNGTGNSAPNVVPNGADALAAALYTNPAIAKGQGIGLMFKIKSGSGTLDNVVKPVMADFFSIGIIGDGLTNDQRVNNALYRWELQETGANTSTFTGVTEYTMINQVNIFDPATYDQLRTFATQVKFVAIQDMLQTEARAPQISYLDLGADGVTVTLSAQQDIPTHTGVVSFDSKTYKFADTVTTTLTDADLNVNNDLVDIYTVVPFGADPAAETVGKTGEGTYSDGKSFGRLLDVQFGQANVLWTPGTCAGFVAGPGGTTPTGLGSSGLFESGFTLVETGPSTGVFTGTYEIPDFICQNGVSIPSVGQNIKVNYVDFRDDSGKTIEVSDNAGVRGNTGSINLDKTVYPVPFGAFADFVGDGNAAKASPNGRSIFPVHRDAIPTTGITATQTLANGDLTVHIRVNDRDYDTSATGTDLIANGLPPATYPTYDGKHGPVQIAIARQGIPVVLGYMGGPTAVPGTIITDATDVNNLSAVEIAAAREFGPMTEIAPDAGIFQGDVPIRFTDGPADPGCPKPTGWTAIDGLATGLSTENHRFNVMHTAMPAGTGNFCIRQGDVITVTYTDVADASGNPQTVTDSATFDLRNGVLQSDKSVYIIGSDEILTLVEPDLNLDSQTAETAPLDLIEWDSHAYKNTMGPLSAPFSNAFDPKPSTFVETGKDTGIFQSVIKIPKQLGTTLLERGEQIHLEYTDWGPAGSKYVGKDNQDIELTIYTSNFGATVELDQKVYTWTDRVYMTVVAPDHNFDPNLIDTIGNDPTGNNKVVVSTRGNSINPYKLVETGVDTGIFTGYVILTGDKTIKGAGGVDGAGSQPTGTPGVTSGVGPTDGFLPAEDSDGVSVSFEFTRDQTVTGSALIRWNIGETKWLEASYPANGQGVLQVVDPDMNLNPKAVDKFDTSVWSDSDSGGIKLTMTETGEATGIFQGTVYFTTNFQSSGNRLHVAEGDTVTGEYKDRTLPAPYTPADQLRLTSTTFIGTIVPPLERAPASNPRIVDSFGNALTSVKVNQQIQITADLTNGQDRDQPFAYLVQIQDQNGVTVSLSWITGTLTGGQALNPAQSWTPTASGTYNAQIFVWQSIDNPNALSPPLSETINVA